MKDNDDDDDKLSPFSSMSNFICSILILILLAVSFVVLLKNVIANESETSDPYKIDSVSVSYIGTTSVIMATSDGYQYVIKPYYWTTCSYGDILNKHIDAYIINESKRYIGMYTKRGLTNKVLYDISYTIKDEATQQFGCVFSKPIEFDFR